MDGVIIDSNPVHREVWTLYNRRFGIETDEAMQRRMYGRRNDEIVRDFFGEHLTAEEIRAHGAAKEQLYRETIGPRVNEALVPGVREFLERHRNAPVGLASNAEPANVEFLLDADPRQCLVFEDSEAGIMAARAAGMAVVGVRTTHRDLAGVDLAIDDFNSPELEPWLARR